jgi:hypothetical protein
MLSFWFGEVPARSPSTPPGKIINALAEKALVLRNCRRLNWVSVSLGLVFM